MRGDGRWWVKDWRREGYGRNKEEDGQGGGGWVERWMKVMEMREGNKGLKNEAEV